MPSDFNGTAFELTIPRPGGNLIVEQVPEWLERNVATRMGSLRRSINGRLALQEIDVKYKPVTLAFRGEAALPAAYITQTMIDQFIARMNVGGTHPLFLSTKVAGGAGLSKTVTFNWEVSPPIDYRLATPTGEELAVQGRLYTGTVYFMERLP